MSCFKMLSVCLCVLEMRWSKGFGENKNGCRRKFRFLKALKSIKVCLSGTKTLQRGMILEDRCINAVTLMTTILSASNKILKKSLYFLIWPKKQMYYTVTLTYAFKMTHWKNMQQGVFVHLPTDTYSNQTALTGSRHGHHDVPDCFVQCH